MTESKKQIQNTRDTRQRILETADAVFAEKGFQNATVAEICEKANANIAAVNYHFRNKVSLYESVLRNSYDAAQKEYPTCGGVSYEASAEIRLEAFIRSMILRAFCSTQSGTFSRFLVHEMTNPTELLETVIRELLFKEICVLREILKQLLPENTPDFRACFFGFNVMGMVMYFSFKRNARERFMKGKTLTRTDIEKLIQHITLFTLSGLKSASIELKIPEINVTDERYEQSNQTFNHNGCCEKQE